MLWFRFNASKVCFGMHQLRSDAFLGNILKFAIWVSINDKHSPNCLLSISHSVEANRASWGKLWEYNAEASFNSSPWCWSLIINLGHSVLDFCVDGKIVESSLVLLHIFKCCRGYHDRRSIPYDWRILQNNFMSINVEIIIIDHLQRYSVVNHESFVVCEKSKQTNCEGICEFLFF